MTTNMNQETSSGHIHRRSQSHLVEAAYRLAGKFVAFLE
jgi:hypothetical protein